MTDKKYIPRKAWKDVPFEDKVAMAGNGRLGREAKIRNGYNPNVY